MLSGFIGTEEFSQRLGYSDSSRIRHFIRDGKIKNCAKISGVWLVSETELNRMIDLGYVGNNYTELSSTLTE